MNCKWMETALVAYLDGVLPARERAQVEQHLRACAECSERVEGFHRVSDLLDGWVGIEPSPSFNARLERRIAASRSPVSLWWERLLDAIAIPVSRPLIAGALMAVMLVAVVLVKYSPPSAETTLISRQEASVVANLGDNDDIALYKDMPVLENWEMLSDFDVLQELQPTTP